MSVLQEKEKNKKKAAINRREFFAALVPVLSIPAMLWLLFTARRTTTSNKMGRKVIIHGDIPAGMSIQQGVILVRNDTGIRAFEAKCTHLGCKISKIEGNELVCPCHGSRFDMEGNPVKGPAGRKLTELSVRSDPATNTTTIR